MFALQVSQQIHGSAIAEILSCYHGNVVNADTPETPLQEHQAHLTFELQSPTQFTATDVRNNNIAKHSDGVEPEHIQELKGKLSNNRMVTAAEVGTLAFCVSCSNKFPSSIS